MSNFRSKICQTKMLENTYGLKIYAGLFFYFLDQNLGPELFIET